MNPLLFHVSHQGSSVTAAETDTGLTHLIINALNLVEETLGPQGFHVVLFEVDSLVVQRLQVRLLVLLPPYFIKPLLSLSPLLLLGLQSA